VIESPFKHEIFEENLIFRKSFLVKVSEKILVSLIHADIELGIVLNGIKNRRKVVGRRRYNNLG
jgi:hypothetical protein